MHFEVPGWRPIMSAAVASSLAGQELGRRLWSGIREAISISRQEWHCEAVVYAKGDGVDLLIDTDDEGLAP